MCLDVDFEGNVLREATPTARKAHKCDECDRTIEPGEKYRLYVVVSWDSGFEQWTMCAHCWGTIELGAALTGCPKNWFWGMIHDLGDSDGGYVGDILTHDLTVSQRMAMLRTVVGRRQKWRDRHGALLPVPA